MKVRLKRLGSLNTNQISVRFQFHEGPIKTLFAKTFNKKYGEFQFHEGPIKTQCGGAHDYLCGGFQFHEGPIKTLTTAFNGLKAACFNSMKVRLKRMWVTAC